MRVLYDRISGDVFRWDLRPKESDYFVGLLEKHQLPLMRAEPRDSFQVQPLETI
jgi:hypothetical protein